MVAMVASRHTTPESMRPEENCRRSSDLKWHCVHKKSHIGINFLYFCRSQHIYLTLVEIREKLWEKKGFEIASPLGSRVKENKQIYKNCEI